MTVQYTNFRGDDYFLHVRQTKKGNPSYYFKKDDPDTTIDEIPEGYEIYEHPNGRVFLTRKSKQKIMDEELDIIKHSMENFSPIRDYKLDVRQKSIYLYTYENPVPYDENPVIVEALSDPKYKSYDAQLCFSLVDKKQGCFKWKESLIREKKTINGSFWKNRQTLRH
ncbi:hypothetical protein JCM21714_2490 [Gracilibacillus boraciitolerans JCM 21714]|uniref:Uncharacterized protein n=1 Tax=Gracilibacillus boraciitolerans JCM 21714 TaxID=1298598 RepID=W4VJ56_9BACI|nr:hypothetical protein [Gracilibacillus boraciitolerans]GAE93410.1 hypothetical protein JCM21714_2490 [Gracilibacillus boraciitolerans JCM 21714]